MSSDHTPGPAALFVVATLIWGSTWLAIRYQLGVVAPEVSVVYRFTVAGLLLMGWCAATQRSLRFSARAHRYLSLQGVLLFGLNYVAVYLAEQYVTSGLVAVLFATIVFMVPIAMWLVYRIPPTRRMFVAAALGVAGVALLFLPEITAAGSGGDAMRGIAYAIAGTALASGGNVAAVRNQKAGIPLFPGTAWGMLYGALAAALAAVAQDIEWTFDTRPAYLWSFAYLVLAGSIAAFGAYLTLLKRVGPGPSAFVGIATPVVALALSTGLEGYRWTGTAALGAALAIIGNLIALRSRGR